MPHELLSDREFHGFKLIAEGKTLAEVGEMLSIGITTVSPLRARILSKMALKSNADLTRYTWENNLV